MKKTLLFFLILLTIPTYAIDSSKPLNSFIYEFYDTSNGLPQNSAASFAQNSKGFMYIATQEGVVKFDGVTMDIFDTSKLDELHSDLIRKIAIDPNDNVFVATDKGLIHYSRDAEILNDFLGASNIDYSDVLDLSITIDGGILFGVLNGKGIFSVPVGSCNATLYTPKNKKISTGNINAVKAFSATEVYAATRSGIFYLKDGKFSKISGSSDSFSAIEKDKKGNIWATGAEGLYQIRENRIVRHIGINDGLPFKYLSSIFIDSS